MKLSQNHFIAVRDALYECRILDPACGSGAFPMGVLSVCGAFGKETHIKVLRNFDASSDVKADDFDILLTTDKLSEGFNLNRAGVVVNYDIPWNPTRVIQRVGRINRIGTKVFENLYIFNFFPTRKGLGVADNKSIAQNKMFAIHALLGEDAQIFSEEEKPTPAALFERLNSSEGEEDEVTSFYLRMKREYEALKARLRKEGRLAKILEYPNRVKCAFERDPNGVFSFRRQGAGFFAVVRSGENVIREWTLEDAISAISCKSTTKRVPFSDEFWKCYQEICAYSPEYAESGRHGGQVNYAQQAVNNLQLALPNLSVRHADFARMVMFDIQNYRTLPKNDIKELAGYVDASYSAELIAKLDHLISVRGDCYLDAVKQRANDDSIVITIETT